MSWSLMLTWQVMRDQPACQRNISRADVVTLTLRLNAILAIRACLSHLAGLRSVPLLCLFGMSCLLWRGCATDESICIALLSHTQACHNFNMYMVSLCLLTMKFGSASQVIAMRVVDFHRPSECYWTVGQAQLHHWCLGSPVEKFSPASCRISTSIYGNFEFYWLHFHNACRQGSSWLSMRQRWEICAATSRRCCRLMRASWHRWPGCLHPFRTCSGNETP